MSRTHKAKPKHIKRSAKVAQFTLNVIAFNLFFAPVWADDKSPFSYAPLHLLNPGQTEMVTHTVTHTVDNVDYLTEISTTTISKQAKPNIMLYLDNSGSMLGNGGRESVLETVRDILPQYANDARWGVTFMNGRDTPYSWATSYHPNIALTDDQTVVRNAINSGFEHSNIYATPMIQGYITAAELLTQGITPDTRCAKNYLIAMTDGVANGGPASTTPAVGFTEYVEWQGRYTAGFIPINAILNKTQYVENYATKHGSNDRVEFAVKMPGKEEDVYLPIDSKFPVENYSRLIAAYDTGAKADIVVYQKALANDVKEQAKKISTKYIDPPKTTDFGMMFVPTESLYAEIIRIPGLSDEIRKKYNISIASPSTLPVMLSGLLMGFRTVAIEKRSAEVWQTLGAVKTQFGKFSELLEGVQKKLQESANKIESAKTTSRQIERKLKNVEELPESESVKLIGEI